VLEILASLALQCFYANALKRCILLYTGRGMFLLSIISRRYSSVLFKAWQVIIYILFRAESMIVLLDLLGLWQTPL
jgi:hypothetical protein